MLVLYKYFIMHYTKQVIIFCNQSNDGQSYEFIYSEKGAYLTQHFLAFDDGVRSDVYIEMIH